MQKVQLLFGCVKHSIPNRDEQKNMDTQVSNLLEISHNMRVDVEYIICIQTFPRSRSHAHTGTHTGTLVLVVVFTPWRIDRWPSGTYRPIPWKK